MLNSGETSTKTLVPVNLLKSVDLVGSMEPIIVISSVYVTVYAFEQLNDFIGSEVKTSGVSLVSQIVIDKLKLVLSLLMSCLC